MQKGDEGEGDIDGNKNGNKKCTLVTGATATGTALASVSVLSGVLPLGSALALAAARGAGA